MRKASWKAGYGLADVFNGPEGHDRHLEADQAKLQWSFGRPTDAQGGGDKQMNAPFANAKPRHFLDLSDHDSATLKAIIADARKRKLARGAKPKGMPDAVQPMNGKVVAMIFDKQSTRTRISFDMAARQVSAAHA